MKKSPVSESQEGASSRDNAAAAGRTLKTTASIVASNCGLERTVDIATGRGELVQELLRRGVDAYGCSPFANSITTANSKAAGRFFFGSTPLLPFKNNAFSTVIAVNCLERFKDEDVEQILAELCRVARNYVLIDILPAAPTTGVYADSRELWEARLFQAGLRRHPAYYRVLAQHASHSRVGKLLLLLEKVPRAAWAMRSKNFGAALAQADLLRMPGTRASLGIASYEFACRYVRPGDRVLDPACGCGGGAHIVRFLTQASSITGIDASESNIHYARLNYGVEDTTVSFELRTEEVFKNLPEHSFDLVLAFDAIEPDENFSALLQSYQRLLAPGGRLLVKVLQPACPDDAAQALPGSRQEFQTTIEHQLSKWFIPETSHVQKNGSEIGADAIGIAKASNLEHHKPADISSKGNVVEWVFVAMKCPLVKEERSPSSRRKIAGLADRQAHAVALDTRYPWAYAAMFHMGFRLANIAALRRLYEELISREAASSSDHRAALAGLAYMVIQDEGADGTEVQRVIANIDTALQASNISPYDTRWKVSLNFAKAKLLQKTGLLQAAINAYEACATIDSLKFSPHLGTKTTEALFLAGLLSQALGQNKSCEAFWRRALQFGSRLLQLSLVDIVIDTEVPNAFDYGDGIRECSLAWDNIARAANGLHLLGHDKSIRPAMFDVLQKSFSSQREALAEELERSRSAVDITTQQLVELRDTLVERSGQTEAALQVLAERTEELVELREKLAERSGQAKQILSQFETRTQELVLTRAQLVERSAQVQTIITELQGCTEELVYTRSQLAEKDVELSAAKLQLASNQNTIDELSPYRGELQLRDRELKSVRELVIERSSQAEAALNELKNRTDELATTRSELVSRSVQGHALLDELAGRTDELISKRQELLAERNSTRRLSAELASVQEQLLAARVQLAHRWWHRFKRR